MCVSSADARIVGNDNKDVQTWDLRAQLMMVQRQTRIKRSNTLDKTSLVHPVSSSNATLD